MNAESCYVDGLIPSNMKFKSDRGPIETHPTAETMTLATA